MSKDFDPSLDIDAILADFTSQAIPFEEDEQLKVYTRGQEENVAKVPAKLKKPTFKLDIPPKLKELWQKHSNYVFIALSILSLVWLVFNVHPASGPVSSATSSTNRLDLVKSLEISMNNSASNALSELTYIKKIYTIEESVLVAPKPNSSCYGRTTDPAEIQTIIDAAADLLEGQEVVWNPDADFLPGSEIRYYLDDSILVIAWKENIDGKACTCAEVKIAHGSQLRRKISDDSYGSSVQMKASDMAQQVNSVIAINGDFYAFRNLGITGYQRNIYRCNGDSVDSCFFTADGDMLFSYAGEITDWNEAQKFMDDNNCTFAIAFGPVLIDNGELKKVWHYPIGEIDRTYSRAAIGMVDELHYVLMTINYEPGFSITSTIWELGDFMYRKGCDKAYTLDGGQTSVMVMEGETVNKVDWGIEREMSDIIYFATAIPEEELS